MKRQRKKLTDISTAETKPVDETIAHLERHNTGKTVNQHTSEKAKITVYVSQEAVDSLDDLFFGLRKLANRKKTKVNKSLIVQQAILHAAEELRSKQLRSKIAQTVIPR